MADILPLPAPRVGRAGIATTGQSAQVIRFAVSAAPRIPGAPPAIPMHEIRFEPAGRLAQFMRLIADFEADRMDAGVDGLTVMLDGEALEGSHA